MIKHWNVTFYDCDMDKVSMDFYLDVTPYGVPVPSKQMIEIELGEEIYNTWSVSEIKP